MSIREVEHIPQTLSQKRQSYRAMIYQDLQEAIDKHIENFEFEGDYNYKYLANYAREEAEMLFLEKYYRPAEKKVKEVLKKELEKKYIFPKIQYEHRNNFIKIQNVKCEDRNHVYATINYDFIDHFYDILLEDTKKNYQQKLEQS